MNLRGHILGTVAANLALVGALLWQAARMPAPDPRGGVSITTNLVTEVVSEASPRPAVVSVPGSPPFRWSQLETTNHAQFLTNLLAIGCPPETARDILEARVADDFRTRLRELTLPLQTRFWDLTAADREFGELFKEPELEKQIEALKEERKRVEAELHTVVGRESKPARRTIESELRYLPAEKELAFSDLSARLLKERQAVDREPGNATPAERAARRKAMFERHQVERRALLSDAEWDEYELRHSRHANHVRNTHGFTASTEELRSLAVALRDFELANPLPVPRDSNRPGDDLNWKAKSQERAAAEKAALTARLGEAGFAAFERGSDPRFHTLLKLARRLELAPEAAAQWLAVQTIAQERSSKLRELGQLDDADRARMLLAIRAETERTLQAAVGARGWGAYQRHAGEWLRQLGR